MNEAKGAGIDAQPQTVVVAVQAQSPHRQALGGKLAQQLCAVADQRTLSEFKAMPYAQAGGARGINSSTEPILR